MTIKEEIVAELRNGTPLAEIRRKYRSQSQLYEAIREFLDEADKIVEEKQDQLEKAEESLLQSKAEFERINRQKEEALTELENLNKAKEKLIQEVRRRTEELDCLNADITGLQAKGFTSRILNEIKTIENRYGPDLLSQVKTVEKYRQIEKEDVRLKKSKASLEKKIQALETKKKRIERKVVSDKNKLDELKIRTATFKEAMATVCSLFRNGYSTEDIKSLKAGLDMLGIHGDPLLSITRLVNGLKKQTDLAALQERVVEVRTELATLKKALADAKAEMKVAKQLTKAFEAVRDAGVKAIAVTAEHANNTTRSTATVFESHITESLDKIDAHIQRTMEGIKAELGEWGDLQQKRGKLEEIIGPSLVFLGILKSPEYLKKVPLPLVVQLMERLQFWSEINLQDASIHPSENIHKKDYNLQTWHPYRLPVLIELVYEGLREILIQQGK